ncbi:uncharacterized protein N7529_001547 [Penicillium soppii]|uniref:uncharacterized protein n=1 Tax=Penicillium soppii TaxID=69789 RepID=UPI00254752B7|nr:uncharacterized protein N7529_001547 [Penicillium soppii]KAJ5875963.1 hypothetical protein N7529_001547 [Penicillium soppii]
MVVQITPIGIQNIRWRFYLIWTANRSLEDFDIVFKENLRTWVVLNNEATHPQRPARIFIMN